MQLLWTPVQAGRWMARHLTAIGDVDSTMATPIADDARFSARVGRVLFPIRQRLTAGNSRLLLADYDFDGARVRTARVEVGGAGRLPLRGFLELDVVARRYQVDRWPDQQMYVSFRFAAVDAWEFSSGPCGRISGQPTFRVDGESVEVCVPLATGETLRMAGVGVEWYSQDFAWSESLSAKSAVPTALGGKRGGPLAAMVLRKLRYLRLPIPPSRRPAELETLVMALHDAVLVARRMRSEELLHRCELAEITDAFRGAARAACEVAMCKGRGGSGPREPCWLSFAPAPAQACASCFQTQSTGSHHVAVSRIPSRPSQLVGRSPSA